MTESYDCYADEELWEDEMVGVEVADRPVLLVRALGSLCAYANRCPHQATPLDAGSLEAGVITCSAHNWTFDCVTGAGINPKNRGLIRYQVRTNGGRIEVAL